MTPHDTTALPTTARHLADADADPVRDVRLRARDLGVRLAGRWVLRGLSLELGPGWTALVGPNGAGKSTLLRCLAGLRRPDEGLVQSGADDLARLPVAQRARRLAWLAQQGDPTGELTVRETVALGRIAHLGLAGVPDAADEAAIDRAMALADCQAEASRRLHELSGGERQRALLARALATEAPTLLLDEPTTHLDPAHQLALARLMATLTRDERRPRAVLCVLHDLPIAMQADRLLVLRDGQLRADGSPRDLAVQQALVQAFDGAIRISADARGRLRVGLAFDDVGAA